MKLTLPIDTAQGLALDARLARSTGEALAETYRQAEPYPHIVFDQFLPDAMAEAILDNFPVAPLADDINYVGLTFEHNKRQILPESCNDVVRRHFAFFNSGPFLQFLEGLTGIEALLPDPYFDGGGFHEILKGGRLGIHADFRISNRLHLNRRLNVLIYLNKDWHAEYGGALEIWDARMTRRWESVVPEFNRCVIFSTDAGSFHGLPEPLATPDGVSRKSLALYYYTASRDVYNETPNMGTVFRARPEDGLRLKLAAEADKSAQRLIMKEWLPPVLYRNLRALKKRLTGR